MARKIIYIVGGLIVLLVLVAVLLPFFIDANKFKPQIESAAESALGRKVAIGNIRLALFSGGVSVEDIAISEDPKFGSGSFLTAKSVAVGVEMMPLIFSRQLHVTGVTIDQPEVTLLRAPSGEWNFSSSGRERRCLACRFIVFFWLGSRRFRAEDRNQEREAHRGTSGLECQAA